MQVVVRVGLNRSGNSSAMLAGSSSPVSVRPMVATVEPQQSDPQNKSLEQRRIEAREILMKERQRQITSPGVFVERICFYLEFTIYNFLDE